MKWLLFIPILIAIGDARGFGAESSERADRAETIALAAQPRTVADLDGDWRFSKGDFQSAPMPAFNDAEWRHVTLPHDWSVEGPFGPEFASGTGFAPGGIGWYRKHFRLDPAATNKLVAIEFDGVYDHSEVWINGHYVGGRPYGYSSFECDLTPHLKFGSGENVVAVRVDHSRFADSRWYTGSGIYRHVRLRITDKVRIAPMGVWITTPRVSGNSATVRVETTIENRSGATRDLSLAHSYTGSTGGEQTLTSVLVPARLTNGESRIIVQNISVSKPQLWTVDSPHLYSLEIELSEGGQTLDSTTTPFGIRTFRLDPDKGFFLNDTPMKLKGVCVHHDAGCLGAAVPERVWERRLRTLKEMGVNAIRTSHNPPAPELLDLCDQLGFLVMDEAFDEFTPAKNKWVLGRNAGQPARFGYAENFEEWSVRDVSDMVRRDRNHPSIIMWSVGNEIDFANDPFSHPILGNEYRRENPPAENLVKHARPLIEAVKKLDQTRPVTAALATVAMSDAVGFGELLDAVGYNYQEQRYTGDHAKFPKRVIYGSENSHQFANWTVVRDHEYISGQFLWTGIDYLGEANRWPNHGSSAGLLDLAGFKKPQAWFRQSLWSDQPMVYICASGGGFGGGPRGRGRGDESWNWPSNSTVTVRCYTTCSEVRLTLNDRVVGTKRRADAVQGELTWEVPFEAGVLKAIGNDGGKDVALFELKTAGAAKRVQLFSETGAASDDRDVFQSEFRIVDADGVRVPNAGNEVTFALEGPAELLGVENGDLNSPPNYGLKTQKAFRGRGLAIVRATAPSGRITLSATSPGLDSTPALLRAQ